MQVKQISGAIQAANYCARLHTLRFWQRWHKSCVLVKEIWFLYHSFSSMSPSLFTWFFPSLIIVAVITWIIKIFRICRYFDASICKLRETIAWLSWRWSTWHSNRMMMLLFVQCILLTRDGSIGDNGYRFRIYELKASNYCMNDTRGWGFSQWFDPADTVYFLQSSTKVIQL